MKKRKNLSEIEIENFRNLDKTVLKYLLERWNEVIKEII